MGRIGPQYSEAEIAKVIADHGYVARRVDRAQLAEEIVPGQRKGRWPDAGPDGIRTAGAWRALDSWRRAVAKDAGGHELEDQVPRIVPAVSRRGLREHVGEWFESDGDSPYMLLVADVVNERRLPVPEAAALWGIERLNVPRSSVPAITHVDYCAHSDGSARDQPAVLRHPRRVPSPHGLSDGGQHLVQRPR